jgi:hypothetical protein
MEPERYRDKSDAREAARLMRARETSLQYVDIVAIQILDGEALKAAPGRQHLGRLVPWRPDRCHATCAVRPATDAILLAVRVHQRDKLSPARCGAAGWRILRNRL